MMQQAIAASSWWKQLSLLVLSSCLIGSAPHDCYLLKPSPPWRNSVGGYIILDCARTDDPADDFGSKIVETGALDRLVRLLQHGDKNIQNSSIDTITIFAEFGRLLSYFELFEG